MLLFCRVEMTQESNKISFLIPCLCLCTGLLFGQNYNFINYNIDDGLAHEKITDICEDPFGNLWLATLGGGLSSFNGLEFKNYTEKDGLANNIVRNVVVDLKGRVWAATANGLSVFDGRSFENHLMDTTNAGSSINVICSDVKNNIWFSYPHGGLGRIDEAGKITHIQLEGWIKTDKIIDIATDSKGRVYFVSAIKGLFKYENDEVTSVLSNAEFKGYLLNIEVLSDSSFLLGSNKGLVQLNPGQAAALHVMFKDKFITSSAYKNKNEVWFVSGNKAMRYKQETLKLMNEDHGFTDFPVNKIFCDREGNDWFATEGGGLYKLSNDIFEFYGSQHGLPNRPVTSISKDLQGNYWIGTYGGGVGKVMKNGRVTAVPVKSLENEQITASATDKQGNIWFGTRNTGLIKYNGKECEEFSTKDGLVYDLVRVLYSDSQNNLWIGTTNGLSIYAGGSFTNYTTADGLSDNLVWGISEPQPGKILIVTRKGLNYYISGQVKQVPLDETIFDKRINVCLQDNLGNFWIGYSGHGIAKIAADRSSKKLFTVDNGLSSDLIYNLVFDDSGNLLVGSERGLDKLCLDENFEVQRIKNYGKVEGFDGIRTAYNSIFKDTDGSVWYGNSQGVLRYKALSESLNKVEPIVYISGLKLFYNEVDWLDYTDEISSWHNMPQDLRLPYDENNLVIEYFGNSLKNPGEVTYKFRLEGLENDWSPLTKRREAVYTNLPAGDYTFQLQAANSDGIWSGKYAEFKFKIVPPFWQEPWFYVLTAILLVMGIKFFNDYRVRKNLEKILTIERIRAEELVKVRKRMARDFHDNMGNQLASITVFTNLINLKLKDKSQEINDLLDNIEKHTKSLFNGTKDFIWSIDPESDNLNELFTYIKDFGEELFENTNIDFFSAKDDFAEKPLPSGWSRQIVLIFKEAMTNALKHSGASEVHLELNLDQRSFVLKLWDNGHGAVLEKIKKGNGFKNMSSRAKQIGCCLDIVSKPNGYGLSIELKGELQSEPQKKEVKLY